jgi:asparagine synthase (glutamine-hydrolysing)
MCGICGFTGNPDNTTLQRMTQSIIHRGPDEDGFYYDNHVSLGMRRLSIIDIATGHQPVHNENKTIWAVFNGEIYNFAELRCDMEKRGHIFYTHHSDTEVIVHLYEQYGPDFSHKINGMFAIALWESVNRNLILVRDRMGVKPLFYSSVNGQLIFGSEIKAILAHPNYKKEMDYESVYHYFSLKNIPAPLTAFKNIQSVLPGEMIGFSSGKISKKKWWTIHFDEDENIGEQDAERHIVFLLEDATRLRMRSDVPFGAYLSGGVDSSSIVALMTRFSSIPIKTFALGYEDALKNKEADLFYARKVSKAYKTEHFEYIMSAKELIGDIENVIRAFDQPFAGTISTFFLSKLISRHVKVALSGDGADELFGSYLSHRTAHSINFYRHLREKAVAGKLSKEEKLMLAPCDLNFLEDLFSRSGGNEALWRYFLYRFPDDNKKELLAEEFHEKTNGANTQQLIVNNFSSLTAKDPLNRILEMEWNTQLPDQVLAFVDFLSMAHSVEVRSPFLDYRLVEFAATIPGKLKIQNGSVKEILKHAVAPLLPEGIISRPKEGFVLPIFDWMVEKLRNYCLDALSDGRIKRHGFFNLAKVKGMIAQWNQNPMAESSKIWNLVMFQLWWEQYFG